eukprot:4084123-Pleurochrysis_carterae.AAC.1
MCIDPIVRSTISSAQPSLGIIIMQNIRAIITATRSAFFLILFLLLQLKPQTQSQSRLHLPLRRPTHRFCLALSAALKLHLLTAALHGWQAATPTAFHRPHHAAQS